jgi:RNA polymerase sigma-70 factor, ECF subfamily
VPGIDCRWFLGCNPKRSHGESAASYSRPEFLVKLTREEFERVALEQIDMVDRVARTLTRNSAEADDLVQETYLRALRAWETFDLRSHGIKAWLICILQNLYLTRAAREARQPRAIEEQHLEAVADDSNRTAQHWEASEELNRAMDELTPDLRATLLLWAVEDFSYQQIADALEIPIGTVMSRLHRARQQLRLLLKQMTTVPPTEGE